MESARVWPAKDTSPFLYKFRDLTSSASLPTWWATWSNTDSMRKVPGRKTGPRQKVFPGVSVLHSKPDSCQFSQL